jgi:hypothetical protein
MVSGRRRRQRDVAVLPPRLAPEVGVPDIGIDELQKLTACLKECNREGRIAELTPEWALLLSRVIDTQET